MRDCIAQTKHRVRLDWGEEGIHAIGRGAGIIVVVDVLSFSTAVDVAVSKGVAVMPVPWAGTDVAAIARATGSVLAVPRAAMSSASPYSLSPASLQHLPPDARLILPSPNGAACCVAAQQYAEQFVVAGSLRNADAVAAFARTCDATVAVIAAGERWPSGALRPALEDALGAGAILAALDDYGSASPEAKVVATSFRMTADIGSTIRASCSALELIEEGFADDVELAIGIGRSRVVAAIGKDGFFHDVAALRRPTS